MTSVSHQNPDDGDRDGSRNVGFFLQLTRLCAREDFIDFACSVREGLLLAAAAEISQILS
jgi:hypothetical protein